MRAQSGKRRACVNASGFCWPIGSEEEGQVCLPVSRGFLVDVTVEEKEEGGKKEEQVLWVKLPL